MCVVLAQQTQIHLLASCPLCFSGCVFICRGLHVNIVSSLDFSRLLPSQRCLSTTLHIFYLFGHQCGLLPFSAHLVSVTEIRLASTTPPKFSPWALFCVLVFSLSPVPGYNSQPRTNFSPGSLGSFKWKITLACKNQGSRSKYFPNKGQE